MWLANALSLVRIPLGAALWLTYGSPAWAAGLVATAALSDALDGRVARFFRRRMATSPGPSAGDWLDPLCDKCFVVIALAAIAVHQPSARVMLALIVAREVLLVPVMAIYALRRARGHARTVHLVARPIGKVATVVQFVAAALVAAELRAAWPFAIAAAVLGVAAVVDQIRAARGA